MAAGGGFTLERLNRSTRSGVTYQNPPIFHSFLLDCETRPARKQISAPRNFELAVEQAREYSGPATSFKLSCLSDLSAISAETLSIFIGWSAFH